MSDASNPATRVLVLIEQAITKNENLPTVAVWADVFGLDAERAGTDPHGVYAELNAVREQVDLIEALMAEAPFSPSLYAPYVQRVRSAVSVSNIAAPWQSYRTHIAPDVLLALRYCSEVLPSEPAIPLEHLQDLLNKVTALRIEIEGTEISRSVRDFLLRQLDIIERGIRAYPIKGGDAIRRAFREGFADVAANADLPQ